MRNDLKAKLCLIIKLTFGLALIGLALYVIISSIIYKEDGNLLVNSVLFLMLLSGFFLIFKAVHNNK